MPLVTAIAIYFVLWWLCLFLVLPWGVRGQHEDGDVVRGSEPGAPIKSRMKRKALQTTVLAGIVWLVIVVVVQFHLLSLDSIPFIPDFVPDDV
jgi:predicted secreted protein